jgi:hypothetical protein
MARSGPRGLVCQCRLARGLEGSTSAVQAHFQVIFQLTSCRNDDLASNIQPKYIQREGRVGRHRVSWLGEPVQA